MDHVASTPTAPPSFSFKQARSLTADLMRPVPWIYWTDFLLSIIGGHVLFHLVYWMHVLVPGRPVLAGVLQAICFVGTVILYMRAVAFTHELVHLPTVGFRGFRFAWNMLCGIFFLAPSFTYYPHVEHHRRKHYGTEHDGEYLGLSHTSPWVIPAMILQSLIIPILGFLRFLILSPLCWLIPGARSWVHRHASTLVMDPFYGRPPASRSVMRIVLLQEFLCFLWCVWFIARAPVVLGVWFDWFWVLAYCVGVSVVGLNAVRTLGAHRWTGTGSAMSITDQMLDTVNYPYRPWITELWGPVGMRYHALHHLFPSLPYHNLPEAHRRLMAGLPADSPYRDTVRVSLTGEIIQLWRRAASREHDEKAHAPGYHVEAATG